MAGRDLSETTLIFSSRNVNNATQWSVPVTTNRRGGPLKLSGETFEGKALDLPLRQGDYSDNVNEKLVKVASFKNFQTFFTHTQRTQRATMLIA